MARGSVEGAALRYTAPWMLGYRKVLVLLDLAEGSERVFAVACDIAAHSNAAIVALHVVEYVPAEPMGESLMPTQIDIDIGLSERVRPLLEDMVKRCGRANSSARVEIGNTKAQILAVADEEKPDLIVLGSRERHGLAVLVNFTEDTVLHAAHCDMLAVRLS
jgi:universal stress protein A